MAKSTGLLESLGRYQDQKTWGKAPVRVLRSRNQRRDRVEDRSHYDCVTWDEGISPRRALNRGLITT